MGFLDALTGGKRKLKAPAKDRLFAASTAYVEMQARGMRSRGTAAIVFQQLDTAGFKEIAEQTEQLLAGAAADTGTAVEWKEDEFSYRWGVLRDDDFDDLVVAVNTVSDELQAGGYGDRLLAAVFSFEQKGKRIYLIYNYKRGAFYPFVPGPGDKQRDNEAELRIKAQLDKEGIPWEAEMARWFPLWEIPL